MNVFLVTESKSNSDRRMVDITRDKPIKVAVRVVVPVRDHPKVRECSIYFLKNTAVLLMINL